MCCVVYAAVPWPTPRLQHGVLAFHKLSHLVDGFSRIRHLYAVHSCAEGYQS
jgi:hypothetical protein